MNTSLFLTFKSGIWKNNAALMQLLGLCPLLAVSNSLINGLVLGGATTVVLIASNILISFFRHYIPHEIRIPIFVILIASLVSHIQLFMQAFTYELSLSLGIFIPLIVTNCMIIARAELFAHKNGLLLSFTDAFSQGLGFTWVLVLLGATREILGSGHLFEGSALLGEWTQNMTLHFWDYEHPFLFALLPPGAFILLGLFIALKNYIEISNDVKH
jgi:electron transport complex protein RnfE